MRRFAVISVRFGSARRCFAILVLSLLTALSLTIAPAQARNLFATEQTQNLFVANQSTNTIREFSQTGVDLGYFATTGLNGPTGPLPLTSGTYVCFREI
jgi:hypothetical protein